MKVECSRNWNNLVISKFILVIYENVIRVYFRKEREDRNSSVIAYLIFFPLALCFGTTFAILSKSGNCPVFNDLLKIKVSGSVISIIVDFIIRDDNSSLPVLLLLFNEWAVLRISLGLVSLTYILLELVLSCCQLRLRRH